MTGKSRTEQWGAGLVDVVLHGISPDPHSADKHPQ